MSRSKSVLLAILTVSMLLIGTRSGLAQDLTTTSPNPSNPLKVTGTLPTTPLPPPDLTGPIQMQSTPVGPQTPPHASVPPSDSNQFEHHDDFLNLPRIFAHQWSPSTQVAPDNVISERYLRSEDSTARGLTLKEAIYIAIQNNPSLKASQLDPVASMETVRQANGTFDPNLTAQGDIEKTVVPVTSSLETGGGTAYVQKFYDWNFGINKVSAITNGTWGVTFNNDRSLSNSLFSGVNPSYAPTLALSLSQPLLQNFGWQFATINVRIAESGQKQAQWTYGQALQDFVQKIGGDYWNVVLSEENLEVARAALRFNLDLVRQNAISVKVGTLAPIDLQEAQSAAATSEANVYTAEANLKNSRSQLRQDVMLNPYGTFIPEEIQPLTRPNPQEQVTVDEERALELAVQYVPSLGSMREAIRNALLQVKYSENQVLPQLNLGAQFGLTSTSGTAPCLPTLSGLPTGNCTPSTATTPLTGNKLPFGGIYGDALDRLWGFSYYNYAAVLTFQMPLDNAVPRAALAQARVQYEQQRVLYRAALSQAVVNVESSIANLYADYKRAYATASATYYARQSLHDEQIRFRVGLATTHDLLQFQEEEVSAEGNQVQAEVDLENAKLALSHSDGTLLQEFNINWEVQNPHEVPWYAAF
ncbi:TolC family protein [Candidatus Binatus sp.]|jgi:outer membrane protein|uniref:TolC family protein n=2 Tax=Candidatus Binatus sp. TaxID=2811406 RepID=UPI003C764600